MVTILRSLPLEFVDTNLDSDLSNENQPGSSWYSVDDYNTEIMAEPTTFQQQSAGLEFQHFHLSDASIPYFYTEGGINDQDQSLRLSQLTSLSSYPNLNHPYISDSQAAHFTPDGSNARDYFRVVNEQTSGVHFREFDSTGNGMSENDRGENDTQSKSFPVALESYLNDRQAHEEFACGSAALNYAYSSSPGNIYSTEDSKRHSRRQRRVHRVIGQVETQFGSRRSSRRDQ